MKKLFVTAAVLTFMNIPLLWAESFEARVNRTEIPEGETFLLSLDFDGQSSDSPNLSALDKDFTVYSVSNAYRTNIINNTITQTRQWNLVLMPKNSGTLTIPSLQMGNLQTNPLQIKVVPAGQTAASNTEKTEGEPRFKMAATVDNKTPYVQQQVNYTLTLYDTGGLQGEEPLFLTTNEDWIIKSLGAPKISNKVIGGRNIREIKFEYALFPQKSGKLEVPAVQFNGYYLTKNKRNDPFEGLFSDDMFIAGFGMTDVFASRNPVVLRSKPIAVEVRPAAADTGNWWLPATSVKLVAEFDPPHPRFKVGEAISRIIYLKATGVIDSQLPEIYFKEVPGLKQYPEKPETRISVENGEVVSLEKIVNVYIPQKSGSLTLPEVEIDWFNIRSGKIEKASLPAMQIEVEEGNVRAQAETAQPLQVSPAQMSNENAEVINSLKPTNLYLLLAGAFVLGIILSALLMKLFSGRTTGRPRNLKKYVIAKARGKDLRALRDSLLEWAKAYYGRENINSLTEIEDLANDQPFNCELEKLTEALYARSNSEWKAGSFIKVFERVSSRKYRPQKEDAPLPKLYK